MSCDESAHTSPRHIGKAVSASTACQPTYPNSAARLPSNFPTPKLVQTERLAHHAHPPDPEKTRPKPPTMSEHWKSTPKYWCKYCSVYVRDTKLERQNHEATGRHQGGLKRFLRDIHREHERGEKDKERARREVERLNGVVSGAPGASSSSGGGPRAASDASGKASAAQLAQQREQLAAMGIAMPTEFHGEMAMAGQWTVTKSRVIDDTKDPERVEAKASGVRKREVTEDEKEEAEALEGLFKKQKRWGGTRTMPEDDTELDALLSGDLLRAPVKKEEDTTTGEEVKKEESAEEAQVPQDTPAAIKSEPNDDEGGLEASLPAEKVATTEPDAPVKSEEAQEPAPVMFKKRKPKNIRQK